MEPGFREHAVTFRCGGEVLVGIVSAPRQPIARGMLIVVGGPQYRVGSHRQFVRLAQSAASAGIPVMRFDYRGMGDSTGALRSFEHVQEDIRAAIDCFFERMPHLREVVLWGLCDAASAVVFYAPSDKRVCGTILLNPWVRTPEGEARAYLRHYYVGKLASTDFWCRLFTGEIGAFAAARDLVRQVRGARGTPASGSDHAEDETQSAQAALRPLPVRMEQSLAKFKGHVLVILSGNDLTAQEFVDVVSRSNKWRKLLAGKKLARRDLPGANHTFASTEWRTQVETWTCEWLRSW